MLDLFNLNGCIEDVDIKEGTYRRKKWKRVRGSKNIELPLVKIKFFRTFTGVDVIDCKDKYFIIYFIVKLIEVLIIQIYNWCISKIKLSSRFSLPLLRIVNGKKVFSCFNFSTTVTHSAYPISEPMTAFMLI